MIIGSREYDNPIRLQEESGPELLAWALNDQLNQFKGNDSLAKSPFNYYGWILAMLFFFSGLVTFVYSWIYSKYKLKSSPFLILGISILFVLVFLAITGIGVLSFNDTVLPVGLITSSMFTAAILSWSYHKKYVNDGKAVGSGKYDVFISCSGQQEKWAVENIINPLAELKNSKGKEFKVFFYKASIKLGSNYVNVYKNAILDSKIFIPLMTKEYFESPYCEKEMIYADRLAETDDILILPIAFNLEEVDRVYKDKNIAVIDELFLSTFSDLIKTSIDELALEKSSDTL